MVFQEHSGTFYLVQNADTRAFSNRKIIHAMLQTTQWSASESLGGPTPKCNQQESIRRSATCFQIVVSSAVPQARLYDS